jgi:aryl-alcohol dehydrogenase-like predicted oxidoreductase
MERRRLGQTDMEVSVLGFGGAEIGYARVAPATVGRLLGSALDAGLNAIDTAECYAGSAADARPRSPTGGVERRRARHYTLRETVEDRGGRILEEGNQ